MLFFWVSLLTRYLFLLGSNHFPVEPACFSSSVDAGYASPGKAKEQTRIHLLAK